MLLYWMCHGNGGAGINIITVNREDGDIPLTGGGWLSWSELVFRRPVPTPCRCCWPPWPRM